MNLDAMKAELEKLASGEALTDSEDFNPYDASGGNFDDAYSMGESDGAIQLARSLLKKYFAA